MHNGCPGRNAVGMIALGPQGLLIAGAVPEALGLRSQPTALLQPTYEEDRHESRLSMTLPGAVDKYTPDGRLPDMTDASRS
jgi:uncharacterized protein YidB (DUF937 family)